MNTTTAMSHDPEKKPSDKRDISESGQWLIDCACGIPVWVWPSDEAVCYCCQDDRRKAAEAK